jgi:cellulase/cellobiase CelA1
MGFTADGLLSGAMPNARVPRKWKIDQLMSIVTETEQIAYRQKSCLKSTAQFSDGIARRFFVGHRNILRS